MTKENYILSFIVPIFNGEKFLSKCLDSLLTQNISYSDYEIICIDDYSTDHSVDIVKSYIKKNSNIKLIQNKENKKTGTTCNIGLKHSSGKYLWIVGQDDWIEPNCLKQLIEICNNENLDVLSFNYTRVDSNEKKLHSAEVFKNINPIKGDEFIKLYFPESFQYYLLGYEWRAIYKKKYLEENKIQFPNDVIFEDTTFFFKSILYANNFMSIKEFLYYYRVNNSSTTDFNQRYKSSLIFDFSFNAGQEVAILSNEIKHDYPDFSRILKQTSEWYFKSFTYKIISANFQEKKLFYLLIKQNFEKVKNLLEGMPQWVKILGHPLYGLIVTSLIKPFYKFKKILKTINNPKQHWSY